MLPIRRAAQTETTNYIAERKRAILKDSFIKTVGNTFSFGGRSRRRDLFTFLILSGVIGFFARVAFMQVFSFNTQLLAGIFIQLLIYIPLPALFVRRLHDQDRNGLFAIVILPIIAFNLYKSFAFASGGMTEQLVHPFNPIRLFAIPFVLVAIALALWPGSSGENRYGPDPREVE